MTLLSRITYIYGSLSALSRIQRRKVNCKPRLLRATLSGRFIISNSRSNRFLTPHLTTYPGRRMRNTKGRGRHFATRFKDRLPYSCRDRSRFREFSLILECIIECDET